jgi:hypothetical protein
MPDLYDPKRADVDGAMSADRGTEIPEPCARRPTGEQLDASSNVVRPGSDTMHLCWYEQSDTVTKEIKVQAKQWFKLEVDRSAWI